MFSGPPLPLSPDLSLTELFAHAHPSQTLGAWVHPSDHPLRIYQISPVARRRVLASGDLGFLLARCRHIALREGEHSVVLEAETVIQWRALQVATATPYLPGLARLEAMFPGLHATTKGLLVPVGRESPEEVLAVCLEEGVGVKGSRIVYARAEQRASL